MKTLRLIVSIRLAFFPIVFNLGFAQEAEVSINESSFGTSENEIKNLGGKVDEQDTQDSSLRSEGQEDAEQPLSPQQAEQASDSSPSREQNLESESFSPDRGSGEAEVVDNETSIDSSPSAQNDEQENDTPMDSSEQAPQNDNLQPEEDENDEELDPELIISEVYYDGKDEWIEIFNIGDGAFYGDIEIAGEIYYSSRVSQTYTDIQIPAKDFLIIANSDEMFDFESGVNIILNEGNYKKFSIGDTKEIQISLNVGGEEVDSFYAHEYRVKKRDNREVSFHKVLTENGFVVTWAGFSEPEDRENISSLTEVMATPGVLISTDEKVEDYSKDPTAEVEPEPETKIMDCEDVYQSPVTVSEIFWGGSRYNPYIEFDIHDDLEWYDFEYLEIAGSLVKTPIYIDLLEEDDMYYDIEDLEKNTKLILTTTEGSLTEAGLITIVLQPNLELNDTGGELEIYGIDGQSRQLLDIVKIGSKISEKSVYRPNSIHTCGEEMDNVMDFSPGFDESALKYFSVTSKFNEKVIETVKYVGGGGGCSCPSKQELCGNVVETEGDILTGSEMDSSANAPEGQVGGEEPHHDPLPLGEGIGMVSGGQAVKIISLEPKTPESITLQSFLPYDIDFKNHNYYLKTSTATTKKYIDGILYANTIDTFSKSFGFVDAGACVYLYSGESQLDFYCYSSQKLQDEKEKQETENFNPSDYQISITHIDYDPEGSDSGNETITIQSNSSKSLDLSKIKMKVNSTNKKLTGILEPYSSITLKGSFGFPNSTKDNSDVVVILFYDNHIFSTFTYNPNRPKVEIPQGAVKVYSVIDGDTFRYRKEDGSLQSVRLLGVDAPESNTARYRSTECFGKEAKNYLTNLIKNQYVTLEFDSNSSQSDAYGRMLAYVYLDGKLVNETLIAEGYAKEYTYKTSYTHQSLFKQAEEKAKRGEKGLWSSSICGKSIAEEPEAWGVDYEKLSIKISDVIYDPDGTDSGNEIVQLNVENSQISVVSSINFSDDFSLTIFPRSEYSTGITKTKKLSEFGIFDLSSSSKITLKGNFGLPNNRATCVSLNQGSYTFDTRCYNPNGMISEEELVLSGQVSPSLPDVKIQSITPNPSGTDAGKEEISLLRTPSQDFPESLDLLDLSSDFSLLINGKTKKKLVGNLTPNQKITIKGSFGLPNSASCVSLLYHGEELDNFCYSKASDGVKFSSNNTSVREISAEELAIVKKITLVKKGDKLCISYNKTIFSCKSIPNSTTEKNAKLLSMQNSYISELENYIKSSYSMIYYDSQLKDYFNLYSAAKKAIKAGSGDFTRGEKNISLTDVSSLFQSEYEQGAKDYFVQKMQSIMPECVSLALLQAEDEYNKKQVEKSDLSFLSLAE